VIFNFNEISIPISPVYIFLIPYRGKRSLACPTDEQASGLWNSGRFYYFNSIVRLF